MYRSIATGEAVFFRYIEAMDHAWENAVTFFNNNYSLVETYISFRNGLIGKEELKAFISTFCINKECVILDVVGDLFAQLPCVIVKEMQVNLFRKMVRMRELETKKHLLPEKDICDNIKTAIKSAVYMNFRYLYNDKEIAETNVKLHCALFFFMRNYAYSGMFRYSNKGEFNVPYGGIAYNSKYMGKKLTYYRSSLCSITLQILTSIILILRISCVKLNQMSRTLFFLIPHTILNSAPMHKMRLRKKIKNDLLIT